MLYFDVFLYPKKTYTIINNHYFAKRESVHLGIYIWIYNTIMSYYFGTYSDSGILGIYSINIMRQMKEFHAPYFIGK